MSKSFRGGAPVMDVVSTLLIASSWVLIWLLWPAVPGKASRPSGGERLAYTVVKYTPELSTETLLASPIETFLIASELEREQFQGDEALELMQKRRFPFPETLPASLDPVGSGPQPARVSLSERAAGVLESQKPHGYKRIRDASAVSKPGVMIELTSRLQKEALVMPEIPEGIDLTGSWSVDIFVEFSRGLDHPTLVMVESSTAPPEVLRRLLRLARLATVTNPAEGVKGVVTFSNRQASAPASPESEKPKEAVNEN